MTGSSTTGSSTDRQLVLKDPEGPFQRQLFSLQVEAPEDLAEPFESLTAKRFLLFLAWDAREVSDAAILSMARSLVSQGLAYVVVWGPDCERVHDLFDEVDVAENEGTETVIMSTWHDNETLEEALWFALYCAYPSEPYDQDCTATVAVAMANPAWGEAIQGFLSDVDSLQRAVGLL